MLRRDERGVAYVEFLLAFVPLMTLFLVLLQLVLVWCGRILVQHAANRAARAASVVLDDDPAYYGDERRGETRGEDVPVDDLAALYRRLRGSATPLPTPMSRRGTIDAAAMLPLMPLAPIGTASVRDAITPSPDADAAADIASRTVVDVEPSTDDGPRVAVRVRFRFPCAVPVASRLVCGSDGERELSYGATLADHVAAYPYLDEL